MLEHTHTHKSLLMSSGHSDIAIFIHYTQTHTLSVVLRCHVKHVIDDFHQKKNNNPFLTPPSLLRELNTSLSGVFSEYPVQLKFTAEPEKEAEPGVFITRTQQKFFHVC